MAQYLYIDGEIARNFTTSSKIGMVGVNVPIPVPMVFHSFGVERSLFQITCMVWKEQFLYKA